jgi:hypothetical protein
MISKVTWALPIVLGAGIFLLRGEDGREIFPKLKGSQFSIDKTWKSLVGGVRVPAALLASKSSVVPSKRIVQSSGISSLEEFRAEYPNEHFPIWTNESIAGMRLLEAEKREGPEFYPSWSPVFEKTPPGFVRLGESIRKEGWLGHYRALGCMGILGRESLGIMLHSTNERVYLARRKPSLLRTRSESIPCKRGLRNLALCPSQASPRIHYKKSLGYSNPAGKCREKPAGA